MKCYLIALGGACAVTVSRSMRYTDVDVHYAEMQCPHFSLAIISVTAQLWI